MTKKASIPERLRRQVQQIIELTHSLMLHMRQHMGVDIQGHTDLTVAQDLLNNFPS